MRTQYDNCSQCEYTLNGFERWNGICDACLQSPAYQTDMDEESMNIMLERHPRDILANVIVRRTIAAFSPGPVERLARIKLIHVWEKLAKNGR